VVDEERTQDQRARNIEASLLLTSLSLLRQLCQK